MLSDDGKKEGEKVGKTTLASGPRVKERGIKEKRRSGAACWAGFGRPKWAVSSAAREKKKKVAFPLKKQIGHPRLF